MKNVLNVLETIDKFITHQDIAQLKKEISKLENFPTRPILFSFFCAKYKTRTELAEQALMTIALPVGAWLMMGQLFLSSFFYIGKAIIYDFLMQQNLKSSAVHFGVGALYACLSCICAIGVVIAPVVNMVSIIARLILSKPILVDHDIESIPEAMVQLDSTKEEPIIEQLPFSARERFIQNRVREAREQAEANFDRLVIQTKCRY